ITGSAEKSKSEIFLLGLVVFITSLSATDLFPGYVKIHFIKPFSLKALPCFIVWAILLYKLLFVIPERVSNIQLA
ncbi:MAG: hypothetical protein M3N30_06635, partial [Bacteroidota bacterium]|nr:hypothetical protein [Bacteroidota bacterium]